MPKFTIFWLLMYFGGMFASLINPIFGVLAYLFEYHLRPTLHWWGRPLPSLRWNLMIGTVALVTFLMRRSSLLPLPQLSNPALLWFIAMIVNMGVVTIVAVDVQTSLDTTIAFIKLLILYGLLIGNIRTPMMFNAILAMCIAGAGWWGWEAYNDPRRVAGRLVNVGSSDTLTENLAAAHLLTIVPFLCVYALIVKDKRMRALAVITAPFIINTFILCNSRGATMGLAASFVVALWLARRGHRIRVFAVAVVVAVMFYALSDPQFIERQRTTFEDDEVGAERIETWTGAIELLKDRPWGAGGGGFEYLSPVYIPEVVARRGELRAVHNTYLLIATEWGIQGLVLFVGFIGSTFVILYRVRKRSANSSDSFYYYISAAIQIGLVGTLTAAVFSNRFSGESIYWMCAFAYGLYRVQASELGAEVEQPARVSDAPEAESRFRAPNVAST